MTNTAFTWRFATIDDANFLYLLRTDKTTQKSSLNSETFSFEHHVQWLNRSLQNPKRHIYIYCLNNVPIGMGRADYDDIYYTLSWAINAESRGEGLGQMLVKHLTERYSPCLAIIKNENYASIKIVEKLGFSKLEAKETVTVFKT